MRVFDCLINKGQEPKVGMEYFYAFDIAWPIYRKDDTRECSFEDDIYINLQEELDSLSHQPYSIKVEKYIVVTDVVSVKRENGYHIGYDFIIKDSGIRCHCNYPWAFWENTPENLININQYKFEQKKLDEQEKLVNKLRNNINQLTYEK